MTEWGLVPIRIREVSVHRRTTLFAIALSFLVVSVAPAAEGGHWPSFRGSAAEGVAEGHATPESFSVPRGENVLWKSAIPGLGLSSPVVWGDVVFLTTAVGKGADTELKVGLYGNITPVEDDAVQRFQLIAIDKRNGEMLWTRTAHEGVPQIKRHTKSSHANSSPATDGKYVVAFFGSEGLYVYDMKGELKWKKDLGRLDSGFFRVPDAQWGFGSSPIIHGDRVIVQCDVQEGSFLAAYALEDGRELWRMKRDEVPGWSTPTVHVGEKRAQVLVNGWKHLGGYDLETGRELWRMHGSGDIPVPTPIVGHDLAYFTHAHGGSGLWAIRLDAKGDLTPEEGEEPGKSIAWHARSGAYMQTPLLYGDELYVCRDNGVLSVYDAKSGKRHSQRRLGTGSTGFTASAVAADGKLYYTSEMGDVHILRAGPEPEVLATGELGGISMATPAVSEGVLYFRTQGHLIAVGEPKQGG